MKVPSTNVRFAMNYRSLQRKSISAETGMFIVATAKRNPE